MNNTCLRGCGDDLTIQHLDYEWLIAVEAWGVDPNPLVWEQPANCQRLYPSLAPPFLLAVDRYLVLTGYIGKWAERDDPVGLRLKPPRMSGGEQVMESLTRRLYGNPEVER